MRRAAIIGLGAYAAVAVVTFGHSAAGHDAYYEANCSTVEQRRQRATDCVTVSWIGGLFAGVTWPLYWSWEAWS